jgi:predicted transcriptional regulator
MNWWRFALGGAAAAALAAGVAHAFPEASVLLGALALYNRVEREGNFENDTRRRIFDHVRTRPGESISQIATVVGVSHSTASYHLDRLVEFNLLTPTPDGNKVRFFVNGGMFTDEDRRVLTALTNAETRNVLATILAHPGSYRAELTNLLGVSSPTVNWHLARLLQAGLVLEDQRGRNRYLFADPRRIGGLLRDLSTKVRGTAYDDEGLRQLAQLCGA